MLDQSLNNREEDLYVKVITGRKAGRRNERSEYELDDLPQISKRLGELHLFYSST